MEKLSYWYGKDVLDECKRLRKVLEPICLKYHGPIDQISSTNTMYPFVLLLGNHSSGKSSFINYLLKRKVQMTGVAPTDDCFTIIGPGNEDIDRNGPALIGDPDLGFQDLKSFGPILINHTQLKVRTNTAVKDFMIVDSPGMIDSPVSRATPGSLGEEVMDRGYDFENVCRWYAERADVILLFFDPDKPGTTGETLSILTNALVGLDHKLYIILNKADQFHRIHDFARAYGSLCWNLSKVIPRKDLPRIHTMCIPVPTDTTNTMQRPPVPVETSSTTSTDRNSPEPVIVSPARSYFDQGILDLEEGREEVIKEVYNAPRRRVDNEISRLFESVSALQMHCQLVDHIVQKYQSTLWRLRLQSISVGLLSIGVTYGMYTLIHYLHQEPADQTPLPQQQVAQPTQSTQPSTPPAPTSTTTTTTTPAATTTNPAPALASAPVSSVMTKPSLRGSKGSAGGTTTTSPTTPSMTTPSTTETTTTTTSTSDTSAPTSPSTTTTTTTITNSSSSTWSRLSTYLLGTHWKETLIASTGVLGVLATSWITIWNHYHHAHYLQTFNHRSTFERILRHDLFAKELASKDAFIENITEVVLDKIGMHINSTIIPTLPRLTSSDTTALHRILQDDIAHLRRQASPTFPTNDSRETFPTAAATTAATTNTTATAMTSSAATMSSSHNAGRTSLRFPSMPHEDSHGNAQIFTREVNMAEDTEEGEEEGKEEGKGEEEERNSNRRVIPPNISPDQYPEPIASTLLPTTSSSTTTTTVDNVSTHDDLDIVNAY